VTKTKWIVAVVVLLAVAGPVGTWVYFNVVSEDAPPKLSLESGTTVPGSGDGAAAAATGEIGGTWKPGKGTEVGYRVNEVAFGQQKAAAGRTDKVTGSMTIDGTTVRAVDLTVDMKSVSSDESRRDNQFKGRIMDVDRFPTARFVLTSPISLAATTGVVEVPATGRLTLRGTTKDVTVDIRAQRAGAVINVNGSIPIVFEEWGIPNPSFGAVSTEDHGELEFLVAFERA
jgi:polyisoprenoid-binding protein YceI